MGYRLLTKTPYCLNQPVPSPDRHPVDIERSLDLGIAHHVVLSKFLHAERVQRKMEPPAYFGNTVHQALGQTPDMGLLSHCLADNGNQVISREGFVVSHMVDSGRGLPGQQTVNPPAEISDRSERTTVLECP